MTDFSHKIIRCGFD